MRPGDRVIIISYADYEAADLAGGKHEPRVVHVDTANRQISEERAKELAGLRRYVEVEALVG
jgi:aspartate 1-decarboxylase